MKIYPLNIYNPNNNYLYSNNFENLGLGSILIKDSFKPSFTAYENSPKVDLSSIKDISGIHCPSCGIKMLSQKDYEKIIERAGKIETTEEFVELLKDYKNYIPNNMRQILSDTDNDEYKNLSMSEYYQKHKHEAFLKKKKRVHEARDYIKNYAQSLPEADRDYVLKCARDLHSKETYKIYKEKIYNIEKYLNFDKKQQSEFNNIVLRPVASSNNYLATFRLHDADKEIANLKPHIIAQNLVENIFKYSVSKIDYIDKHPSYISNPNNTIMECSYCCENSKEKMMFWKSASNPYLKSNISLYLGDIARLIGQGKIQGANDYIRYVCDISSFLSNGKLNFTEEDVIRLKNVKILSSRHEEFMPIEQAKVDIPCACCGSIMLPHSVRLNILAEMEKCNTPFEYAQVLKKYNKYIGRYNKGAAKIFFEIIDENPDISKDQFLILFKQKMDRYCRKQTYHAIKNYTKNREYYATSMSMNTLQKIDEAGSKILNYINMGRFDDYDYLKMFRTCFDDNNLLNGSSKIVYKLLTDLKEVASIHSISEVYEHDKNDKDEIYTILFKIFKMQLATADHLVAASIGGENSKNNLIGLCKSCNSKVKSRKQVKSWYKQNVEMRRNLPIQMSIIDKMAKYGLIEGYDDWAKNIANKMYELTEGKYDIRDKFK